MSSIALSRPSVIAARPSPVGHQGEAVRDFSRRVLIQVLVCIVPTSIGLALARPVLAGYLFFGTFVVLATRLVMLRRPEELLSLAIAVAPFMNFLRGFFFYHFPVVFFAAALVYYRAMRPSAAQTISRLRPLRWVFLWTTAYYAVSLLNTRDYTTNLRGFELALGCAAVVIIARSPVSLIATLRGLLLSTLAVGAVLTSYLEEDAVDRLGMVVIGEYGLGNPIQLGLPLALGLLTLAVDRGRWLGLGRRPIWRYLLLLPATGLLLLTTSRGAYLVAVGGLLMALFFGRRSRVGLLVCAGLVAVAIPMVLATRYGEGLRSGLLRTFDDERTVANRTSGRSDQWIVAGVAARDSARRFLFGYGPGMGPATYARVSPTIPGVTYQVGNRAAIHSLYMQVLMEAGALALGVLVYFFVKVGIGIVRWTRRTGLALPLAAFVGFLLVLSTVSGRDIISAVFLGLGLAALSRPTWLDQSRTPAPPVVAPSAITGDPGVRTLTKEAAGRHMAEMLAMDAGTIGEPWTRAQMLAVRPAKWVLSRWLEGPAGKPIGFAIASEKNGAAHLHRLAVSPSHRSSGVGSRLMTALAEAAAKRGLARITLKVGHANVRAVAFYERLGFNETSRDDRNLHMAASARSILARERGASRLSGLEGAGRSR